MQRNIQRRHTKIVATLGGVAACGLVCCPVEAQHAPGAVTETVLHSFAGEPDSADPEAGLVADTAGNLYGTTQSGGSAGHGSVFELSPPKSGKTVWSESVIHSFTQGADGGNPFSTLLIDGSGSLYGTAGDGGATGRGVVFKLSPPKHGGGTWTETVLHSFGVAPDGFDPFGNLAFDKSGLLYGTTILGGENFGGVVFQLKPPKRGNGEWAVTILHSFAGDTGMGSADGANPFSGVLYDPAGGSLYGTTLHGGPDNYGTVFQVTPKGHNWQETVVHTFAGNADGAYPSGQMVLDGSGVLYGTMNAGGKGGYGGIYSLTSSGSKKAWTLNPLYSFTGGADGEYPIGGLTADMAGNLFGTTAGGGKAPSTGATCQYSGDALAGNFGGQLTNCGTVFQLQKSGAKWTLRSLYSLRGVDPSGYQDGNAPDAAVIFGAAGTLYGTTTSGGSGSRGTVFKLTY